MTWEMSQVLLVIGIISIACAILSPILWWILPNRSHSV
jgi:hypothetical protein